MLFAALLQIDFLSMSRWFAGGIFAVAVAVGNTSATLGATLQEGMDAIRGVTIGSLTAFASVFIIRKTASSNDARDSLGFIFFTGGCYYFLSRKVKLLTKWNTREHGHILFV